MRRMKTIVKKTQAGPKAEGKETPAVNIKLSSKRHSRPVTHNASISDAVFLRKMEAVDLRTEWDMQKVSTGPEELSRNKVYIQ